VHDSIAQPWSLLQSVEVLYCAMCCSVLQCVAVCCSVLQCVAVCCSVLRCVGVCWSVLECVAVCCSMSQCVAHNKLQHTGTHPRPYVPQLWDLLQRVAACCSVLCVAMCYSVLRCIAVCCSVLQCVAVCCSVLHTTHCNILHVPTTLKSERRLLNLRTSSTRRPLHPPTLTSERIPLHLTRVLPLNLEDDP